MKVASGAVSALPPIHAARCLVVDAPHDRPELAGRPVTFEGFRLADSNRFVGWTVGMEPVLLLEVTRPGAPWSTNAPTTTAEPDMFWDAKVIGAHESAMAAHAAADEVFGERG